MKRRFILLYLLLITSPLLAQEQDRLETIEIKSSPITIKDQVKYQAQKQEIKKPASDLTLGDTLSKLPGVLVRETSGFGSLTTILGASSLSAGQTPLLIDGVPQPDPLGIGINLSLLPSSLFSNVSVENTFYQNTKPQSQIAIGAGSSIAIGIPEELKSTAIQAQVGSGNSGQLSVLASPVKDSLAGISLLNTKGDFPFKNPYTGAGDSRNNNNAFGGGGVLKKNFKTSPTGKFSALGLGSYLSRTNSGDIRFPSRDHETDHFSLVGLNYEDPELFNSNNGLYAKASVTQYRILVRRSDRDPFGFSQDPVSLTKTLGHYQALGHVFKTKKNEDHDFSFTVFTGVDQRYEILKSDNQFFNRSVVGMSLYPTAQFKTLSLGAGLRQELNNRDPNAFDSSLFLENEIPHLGISLFSGLGWLHTYPSISSQIGSEVGSFKLLPNPALKVERDLVFQAGFQFKNKFLRWSNQYFRNEIHNRATYTMVTATESQVVNSDHVRIHGVVTDFQIFDDDVWSLRSALTYLRAYEQSSRLEMPYKPRFQGRFSAGLKPLSKLGFVLTEEYFSSRKTALGFGEELKPFFQTEIRADFSMWNQVLFFKITNLLDRAGLENVGYPFSGRSFLLGLDCVL